MGCLMFAFEFLLLSWISYGRSLNGTEIRLNNKRWGQKFESEILTICYRVDRKHFELSWMRPNDAKSEYIIIHASLF